MADVSKNKYWGAANEVLASLSEQSQLEEAEKNRQKTYQDMMDARRKSMEAERTNATTMAKFNALGNALRTMVQPLGWAVGGSTAGVQPYDNRAYLDAFNRAVKAGADVRNLDAQDMQFQLGLANEKVSDAKRALETRRAAERAAENAERNYQNQLALVEAKAAARGSATGGDTVNDAIRKRAATKYADYVTRSLNNGKKPISMDDYLEYFALTDDGSAAPAEVVETAPAAAPAPVVETATPVAAAPATAPVATAPAAKPVTASPAKTATKTATKTAAKTAAPAKEDNSQSVKRTGFGLRGSSGLGFSRGGVYAKMVKKDAAAKEEADKPVTAQETAAQKWGGTAKKKKK